VVQSKAGELGMKCHFQEKLLSQFHINQFICNYNNNYNNNN